MATKKRELEKKKAHARELLKQKPGLSVRDLENLTGLTHTTAARVRKDLSQETFKSTLPPTNAPASQGIPPSTAEQEDDEDGTLLDFQESPDPVGEQKSIVDRGMDSLKGLLGIKDKDEQKPAAPIIAKLDPRRQAFVDNISPTVALGFTLSAAWMWGKIGPEYKQLAPDDKTATRIVEPLVRIYARHASFLTDVNPDMADAGASLVALIGYIYSSMSVYQLIKQEQLANEQEQSGNVTPFSREYRSTPPESRTSHQSGGLASVSGGNRQYGTGASTDDTRHQPGVNRNDLTGKEAVQFEALSRLSQLDYQSRARRSGQVR